MGLHANNNKWKNQTRRDKGSLVHSTTRGDRHNIWALGKNARQEALQDADPGIKTMRSGYFYTSELV